MEGRIRRGEHHSLDSRLACPDVTLQRFTCRAVDSIEGGTDHEGDSKMSNV